MLIKVQYNRSSGLGNKLFPWARAIVLSKLSGGEILDPVWFSPRGAGIIRGGIDYRKAISKIWLFNNFLKISGSIGLMRQLFIRDNSFECVNNLPEALELIKTRTDCDVMFRWNSCHDFMDLSSYRDLISGSLLAITPLATRKFISQYEGKRFIGVNIRCGNDFRDFDPSFNGYFKTDINWFPDALRKIRSEYGDMPAIVVSDGSRERLRSILSLPDVSYLDSSNALQDLLVLSGSSLLLGSGCSSFSAWASFLGGMHTYSSPQTPFKSFHINYSDPGQIVDVFN